MIIYNIFPLLAGKFAEWDSHFRRASDMGFNWIFLNPIQQPGYSGSLYSIKDYFSFNPLLIDENSKKRPELQVKNMVRSAEKHGLNVMVDLVINHCAFDSELIKQHPEWFVWEKGRPVSPSCKGEDGKKVVWGDLVKFNVSRTKDPEGLYNYFHEIVDVMAGFGFKGFRCDAAYQMPAKLWKRLISDIKKKYPDVIFAGETLGCTPAKTKSTAMAGFDYIFNSSKWWDFKGPWLKQQYDLTRSIVSSISFPESHDTMRLMEELEGNVNGLKQRYFFSALFSSGVMMPMGFEFGFRKSAHVVKTRPQDWEETGIDISWFIKKVNDIKKNHAVFMEESEFEIFQSENPNIILFKKRSGSGDEALVLLNKDLDGMQNFHSEMLQAYFSSAASLRDISPEYPVDHVAVPFSYDLNPGQGLVYVGLE